MKETEKMKRIRALLNTLNKEIRTLTELINLGINEQTIILQLKHTEKSLNDLKKEYENIKGE